MDLPATSRHRVDGRNRLPRRAARSSRPPAEGSARRATPGPASRRSPPMSGCPCRRSTTASVASPSWSAGSTTSWTRRSRCGSSPRGSRPRPILRSSVGCRRGSRVGTSSAAATSSEPRSSARTRTPGSRRSRPRGRAAIARACASRRCASSRSPRWHRGSTSIPPRTRWPRSRTRAVGIMLLDDYGFDLDRVEAWMTAYDPARRARLTEAFRRSSSPRAPRCRTARAAASRSDGPVARPP